MTCDGGGGGLAALLHNAKVYKLISVMQREMCTYFDELELNFNYLNLNLNLNI